MDFRCNWGLAAGRARASGRYAIAFSKSLGLVDAVVRTGVPIVIGHRWPLLDSNAAVRLVQTFYEKLLGESAPEQAMLWARRSVKQHDPTWASPVMVVQATDGI